MVLDTKMGSGQDASLLNSLYELPLHATMAFTRCYSTSLQHVM